MTYGEHRSTCPECRAGEPCNEGEALRAAFVAERDAYLARMRARCASDDPTPTAVATMVVARGPPAVDGRKLLLTSLASHDGKQTPRRQVGAAFFSGRSGEHSEETRFDPLSWYH